MKKILAFTLMLVMLIGLIGCTPKTDTPVEQNAVTEGGFRVGYGRAFITP